jgi:hypothetical protein
MPEENKMNKLIQYVSIYIPRIYAYTRVTYYIDKGFPIGLPWAGAWAGELVNSRSPGKDYIHGEIDIDRYYANESACVCLLLPFA